MGRGRCCCSVSCVIFSTDFSPCTGDPDADDWYEVSGVWAIVDPNAPDCTGQYLESDVAGSLIICLHPTSSEEQIITVVVDDVANSKPRIIFGADYDTTTQIVSSYYYLEADITGGVLTIGSGSWNGSSWDETPLGTSSQSFPTGTTIQAYISGVDGSNVATISGGIDGDCSHLGTWVCGSQGGRYAGLGNGPGATADARFLGDFYSFTIRNHTDTPNVDEACGQCDCHCDTSCVPWTLNYTLTKLSGAACCTGGTGTIEFDPTDPAADCRWIVDIDVGCGFNLQFSLAKSDATRNTPCGQWTLQDTGYPGWNNGTGGTAPDTCTCDPFYMKWEFTVEYGDDTCEFRFEINDPDS